MHEARLDGNGTPGGGAKRYKRNAHNQRTTATLNSRTANVGGRQTGAHNGPTNWARKWWANGIDDANTPESKYSISPICSMCSISSMCSIRSMCCARLLELGPYYSLCYLVTHTNTLLRTRCQSCTHSRNNSHCNNSHYSGIRLLHNLHIFHVLASLRTFIHYIHAHILRTHTPLTHNATSGVIRNTPSSLPHKNPLHTRYQTSRLFQAICRYIFFATDPPRADYLATADEEKIVVSPRIENIRVYYAHRASEEDEAFSFLPLGMLLTVLLRRTIGRAIMRSDTSTCRFVDCHKHHRVLHRGFDAHTQTSEIAITQCSTVVKHVITVLQSIAKTISDNSWTR